MAGLGNAFDSLWTIGVLGASIGVTVPAMHKFGLLGLAVFPCAFTLFGIVACGAYPRLMKPRAKFMLTDDKPRMDNEAVHAVMRPNGWIDCPACKRAFMLHDKRVWNGERHNCGQRLVIHDPS